jgi:two-component system cell cycle sensor histidine kinase/response regulator CckA
MIPKTTPHNLKQRIRELEEQANELMRVEDALRESEAKYADLYDHAPDMYLSVDAKTGRILDCNQTTVETLNYPREEIIGKVVFEMYQPSCLEAAKKAFQAFIETGVVKDQELEVRRRDGSGLAVSLNVTAVRNETGKILYSRSIWREITRRKIVEKALRESEALFRTAYQTIPDPVTIIRAEDGRCVDINEGFTQVTGYTREEVIGKTAQDLNIWVDPKERDRFIAGISKFDQIQNLEADFRIKNGDVITGLFSAKIIKLEGKPHILSLTRNISELKKAQQEKEELEAQLRQAQKMEAIGTLAGGIAHDFNNILAAIMGYCEMAQFDLSEEHPARYNIDQALKATHRAKDLIKQILAFSRQTKHERKPLQLHLIIEEALKLIRAMLPATIEIHQDIIRESGTVLADPIQIHQVVMNLCSNAHHAMREKGGELRVSLASLEIGAAETGKYPELNPGSYLKLTVADTGHGMEPETIERIFDPYFTTKAREKGTGLGLAVVHGIIKDHGGAIYVESELDRGTVFEILLPRVADDLAPAKDAARSFPTGHERILFVDDEHLLAEIGENMLKHLGYKVVARTSSVEALEKFGSDPDGFDLVISDMTMPKMDGDQLAGEIKRIRPDIPILICTGYSEYMDKGKAASTGIAGYLMKPLSIHDLAATVREILDTGKLKA